MEYEAKVESALRKMVIDQVFIISEKVVPENYEKFVRIVKGFIDNSMGHAEGWQLMFNNDFSKIRKDVWQIETNKTYNT